MSEWRESLKQNWLYMATGTLLSVLLWVAVSADTVAQQTIPADLIIVNNDRRFVPMGREPSVDEVLVVLTGRAGDLAALSLARPQLFYRIDSVTALTMEATLTPEMVRARGGRELSDVRAVDVRPNRVRLYFQPRVRRLVPVAARVELHLLDGYVLADSVRVDPPVVTLEGPELLVNRIDTVTTAPVVQQGLRDSLNIDVPLEQPDVGGLVEVSARSVRVRVPIEPSAERVFPGIPLLVRGTAGREYRVEPSLVDVRVAGPRSVVEALRPESLSPRVELSGPRDFGRRLPVLLDPPVPFVSITVHPDSAQVERPAGGG
jgi:hypothetical protein